MGSPQDNANWVFDIDSLIKDFHSPGGDLSPLEASGDLCSSNPFTNTRVRPESCNAPCSKACREKMRRDRLNDRFMESSVVLDPERPPRVDKSDFLGDAVRMVTKLLDEAEKLKESNKSLWKKISGLKVEKNELRDEKQRLKMEKESLKQQVKALGTPPGFLAPPPAILLPFSGPSQVLGSKFVPFVGYPGVSMWQFMPPAAVDTSQDHVLRPPVA